MALDFIHTNLKRNHGSLESMTRAVNGPCAVRITTPFGTSTRFHAAHRASSGITESHLFWVVP